MNAPPYQPQPPKKSTPWVLIIVGVIAVLCICPVGFLIVSGASIANSKEFKDAMNGVSVNAPEEAKKTGQAYKVEGLKGTNEGGVKYVTGTLTNNSGEKKGYVQVEINLLDKSGAVVGSTLANINNLEPGQKWKFKAVVMEDSATTFQVKNVTGF